MVRATVPGRRGLRSVATRRRRDRDERGQSPGDAPPADDVRARVSIHDNTADVPRIWLSRVSLL